MGFLQSLTLGKLPGQLGQGEMSRSKELTVCQGLRILNFSGGIMFKGSFHKMKCRGKDAWYIDLVTGLEAILCEQTYYNSHFGDQF